MGCKLCRKVQITPVTTDEQASHVLNSDKSIGYQHTPIQSVSIKFAESMIIDDCIEGKISHSVRNKIVEVQQETTTKIVSPMDKELYINQDHLYDEISTKTNVINLQSNGAHATLASSSHFEEKPVSWRNFLNSNESIVSRLSEELDTLNEVSSKLSDSYSSSNPFSSSSSIHSETFKELQQHIAEATLSISTINSRTSLHDLFTDSEYSYQFYNSLNTLTSSSNSKASSNREIIEE